MANDDEDVPPSPEVLRELERRALARLQGRTTAELAHDGYESAAIFRAMMLDPSVRADPLAESSCAHDVREAQPLSPYRRGAVDVGQTVIYCKPCYDQAPDGIFMPMVEVSSGAVCRSCHLTAEQVVDRDGVAGWRRPASEGGGPWFPQEQSE